VVLDRSSYLTFAAYVKNLIEANTLGQCYEVYCLTRIFWLDHMASQTAFHHEHFMFLHHLPGTLVLNTFTVSKNYQPSNAD